MRPVARKVAIVHPVHQHSYESAAAAYEAGLLDRFYTGVYARESVLSGLARAGEVLPGIEKIRVALARRSHPGLPSTAVFRLSGQHWLVLAAAQARAPMHGRNPRLATIAQAVFDRRVARSVAARRNAIGLLHAFDLQSPVTLGRAHAIGIPTILDVTIAHTAAWYSTSSGGDHPARETLASEREASDWFLVGSTNVRDEIVAEGADRRRVLLLPYGADPDVFQPDERERGRDVLFVGQLTIRKGLDLLLEGWQQLGPPPGRQLVLVGSPDAAGERLLCRQPQVVVRPHMSREMVAECMRTAALFVLPSRAEGSALAVYEAMAAALPVVTTKAAGSVIRDGVDGYLVGTTAADLAAAMDRILSNPRLGTELGHEARRTIVSTYTWKHYRDRLAVVYSTILAGGSPRIELPSS
jgi:glycosyltransferase involved in cell wall biosynthesis